MGENSHGIGLEADTELDTAGADDAVNDEARQQAQEGAREQYERETERRLEQEAAVREEKAAAQENPDNHRDEPYHS